MLCVSPFSIKALLARKTKRQAADLGLSADAIVGTSLINRAFGKCMANSHGMQFSRTSSYVRDLTVWTAREPVDREVGLFIVGNRKFALMALLDSVRLVALSTLELLVLRRPSQLASLIP